MSTTIPPNNNTGLYNTQGGTAPTVDGNIAVDNIVATGNVTVGGFVSAVGNISGNYILGNGSLLTGLPETYTNANVVSLLAAFGSNTISTTGNITSGYIFGNGSQLTGLPATYSNANVAGFLPVYNGNIGANVVTANLFSGSGATLTTLTGANVVGEVALASFAVTAGIANTANSATTAGSANTANSATTAGTVTGNAQANITSVGTLTSLSVTGNITGGNLNTGGNVTGLFLKTSGVQGNIVGANYVSANYFVGDGSLLTNLPAGNAVLSGNLAGNLQGNGFGANAFAFVSATGNISGNYILGNGSQLTGLPATYSDANVTTLLANFGSNSISTTGNVTTGYVAGNGSLLTNITGANVTGTVANATFATSAGSATTATSADQANYANIANSVSGANVTGSVAQANYANIANSVSGSNVSGSVAQANFANTANAVAGSNVSGAVAQATVADTANSVAGGNVSGQVANALVAGTVYTAAQPNITTVGTLSSLSVSGNVAGGNLVVNNNANIVNDLTVGGTIFGTFAGNITGNLVVPGSNTQVIYNNNGNAAASANFTFNSATNQMSVTGNIVGGNVSTTGNVSGAYISGNGSLLSSITGANITGTVANATYATSAGTATTATTADTANSVAGANVSGSVAQANTANTANSVAGGNVSGQVANALVAGTVYTNAQPNITSIGTLSSLSVTGNIATGGILTDGYYYANGAPFSGGGTYGNANVNTLLAAWGSNSLSTTGNVTSTTVATTNILMTGSISNPVGDNIAIENITTGLISATGNITGAYIKGNISEATGGYGNSNVTTLLNAFGSNSIVTTGNIGNLTSKLGYGFINNLVTDNISSDTGDFVTIENVSTTVVNATGNVNASNLNLTGQIYDSSGVLQLNGSGNIVFAPTGTTVATGDLSATGNITAANLGNVSALNLNGNSSQVLYGNGVFAAVSGGSGSPGGANTQLQFNDSGAFAGNAAMTFDVTSGNVTLGNIRFNNNVITNINSFQSNTNPNPGRILVGSGILGNYSPTVNSSSSRLAVIDQIIKYDDGQRTTEINATLYANLAGGNIGSANSNSRCQAISADIALINGNSVQNNPFYLRAFNSQMSVGSAANTGCAFATTATATSAFITINTGSSANTATLNIASSTLNGNVGNMVGYYFVAGTGSASATGNTYGFYMPGTTTGIGGQSMANTVRGATNYYFLRNDDDLAKAKIGMLDNFHELNANSSTTTGTVTVSKSNGQVQTIYPTGNVTIGSFTNFVTRVQAPNGTQVNTADTVTLIIQQGATPYSITMPTGNTQIRYAGGINTVGAIANTTTMISVTGVYDYGAAANEYLVTISPEFS
jgi:hypothetical protein